LYVKNRRKEQIMLLKFKNIVFTDSLPGPVKLYLSKRSVFYLKNNHLVGGVYYYIISK